MQWHSQMQWMCQCQFFESVFADDEKMKGEVRQWEGGGMGGRCRVGGGTGEAAAWGSSGYGSPFSPCSEMSTTSMRRFFCLPSSLEFSATGWYSPYPAAEMRFGSNSCLIRY